MPVKELDYDVERAATRSSHRFITQMEALKNCTVKAEQPVRVERVNVENGG